MFQLNINIRAILLIIFCWDTKLMGTHIIWACCSKNLHSDTRPASEKVEIHKYIFTLKARLTGMVAFVVVTRNTPLLFDPLCAGICWFD